MSLLDAWRSSIIDSNVRAYSSSHSIDCGGPPAISSSTSRRWATAEITSAIPLRGTSLLTQTSRGRPDALGQVGNIRNPILEQVADPLRATLQELDGIAWAHVLRQDQDAHGRVSGPKLSCGPKSLVGVGRRHPDVDDGDVRAFRLDDRQQLLRVARLAGDLESGVGEQANQALAQ